MNLMGRLILLTCVFFFSIGCTVNILENFAEKTTSEAYFIEARQLINDGDYDGALVKIALIQEPFASNRQVISLKASAHAGKCGFQFLSFVEAFKDLGSSNLFEFLLANFSSGSATRIDSCVTAEDLIESIGTLSQRTVDENLMLALISFAKIGNILSLYADGDDDGVADAGYNACTVGVARAAGALTDADASELGTGLTLAIATLGEVAGSVNLGSDSLSDLSAACVALNGVDPSLNFCSETDPSAFTASQLKAIRSLVHETSDGIGIKTCVGGVTACVCP